MSDARRGTTGEYRFVAPCTVQIKFHGKIDEAQARSLLGRAAERAVGLPYVLLEVDISEMAGASPESRRISAELLRSMPYRIIAVHGGSFAQRIIAKLVVKASEMLSDGRQISSFFEHEADAQAWARAQAATLDEPAMRS